MASRRRLVLLVIGVLLVPGCFTARGTLGYSTELSDGAEDGLSGAFDLGAAFRTCSLSVAAGMGSEWTPTGAHVVGSLHGGAKLWGRVGVVGRLAAGEGELTSLFAGLDWSGGFRSVEEDHRAASFLAGWFGGGAGLLVTREKVDGEARWFAGVGAQLEFGADAFEMLQPDDVRERRKTVSCP